MKNQYQMYGGLSSHFSAKLRGYLNYKDLYYQEKDLPLYDLLWRIPRGIGTRVMPALYVETGDRRSKTSLAQAG
ncbi:MAG: hypothetical protein AAF098_04090 [Pseudomonadota bacterium]